MGRNFSKTKQVNVTLPEAVYSVMEGLANDQGRSVANLAAFCIEYFLAVDAPKLYPFSKCLDRKEVGDVAGMDDEEDLESDD